MQHYKHKAYNTVRESAQNLSSEPEKVGAKQPASLLKEHTRSTLNIGWRTHTQVSVTHIFYPDPGAIWFRCSTIEVAYFFVAAPMIRFDILQKERGHIIRD